MNKKMDRDWIGSEQSFKDAVSSVANAESNYAFSAFDKNEDVTKKQAKAEFWTRIAEHWGFQIINKPGSEP